MRSLAICALAIAALPSFAQAGQVASKQGALDASQRQAREFQWSDGRDRSVDGTNLWLEHKIERAALWGRCVVAAAPAESRAYAQGQAANPGLDPVFARCQRRAGDFTVYGAPTANLRRAAIRDALTVR